MINLFDSKRELKEINIDVNEVRRITEKAKNKKHKRKEKKILKYRTQDINKFRRYVDCAINQSAYKGENEIYIDFYYILFNYTFFADFKTGTFEEIAKTQIDYIRSKGFEVTEVIECNEYRIKISWE